jgi:NAD(P)-dependent dehydrogenase (short-subunit alcohol dehydrogenase family)
MASQAGRRGEPLVAVYCATKAAVISLTQSAGLNLIQARHQRERHRARRGRWRALGRGRCVLREIREQGPGQKKAEVGAAVPFGRMGTAEDLTGMAVFLASDEARYIVAQTYNVDGGQWMS